MPRNARQKSRSGIYHIMLRGNNKQTIFEDSMDRKKFIKTLEHYKQISGYKIYSYCLMTNHVHLLMKEGNEPISESIKRISSCYVYWYNQKYDRCGHLFQERYKSEVVESEAYFKTVLRYIHQNPVKAGIAKNPTEYKWSSYNEYIGRSFISDTYFALKLFSSDMNMARQLFIEHNNQHNDDKCLEYEEKSKITDENLDKYLMAFGLKNRYELRGLERTKRNTILKKMKLIDGITLDQLSKVSGISKSTISRL